MTFNILYVFHSEFIIYADHEHLASREGIQHVYHSV